MTEAEAKTKWCPFSLTGLKAGSGGVAVNRSVDHGSGPYDVSKQTRCIGSDCMAWRWETVRAKREIVDERTGYSEITLPHPSTEDGYCGLAGKP